MKENYNMKILQVHNTYTKKGGEDTTVEIEKNLLISKGEQVEQLFFSNEGLTGLAKISLLYKSIYNQSSAKILRNRIQVFQPDVIHIHNLFYLASPAILYEAQKHQIPVVLTIHNFRLICSGALLLRDGKVCELCTQKKFPLAGIQHKCFQNSTVKTAQLTLVTGLHKILGTWQDKVDAYITLSKFIKNKLVHSSLQLPPEKIFIKPNFASDRNWRTGGERQNFFLFVGRLSQEKGIQVLLEAAQYHHFHLEIIGTGDLKDLVQEYAQNNAHITYHGFQGQDFIIDKMKQCKALLFPSVCYEGMPLTLLEAFSTGTPVIISDIDNLNEMVSNHYDGLHFKTGDSKDLAEKIRYFEQNATPIFYENARKTYENHYSSEKNYQNLMNIYQKVINQKKPSGL
jgi:glycosyltransferase involved in cell wall biosynthesis